MEPSEIQAKINELDGKLSVFRESLHDAAEENKQKWRDRINTALDERLVLMNLRNQTKVATFEIPS